MNDETSNFGKGGVEDVYDPRDFQFTDVARASSPFDWGVGYDVESKVGVIPPKNQNGSFSCGGQAWSYYIAVLEALGTSTMEERSAKYIYAQTHLPGGGSAGRQNCEICTKQGVSVELLCPSYENGNPPSEEFMITSDISQAARDNAHLAQSYSYANVDVDIDLFAQAVRDNNGMIMLIYGKDNGTWLSKFPKPPTALNGTWAHWVYLGKAKMIDGKKYLGFLNSWGNVGENGWQFIGEEYFNAIGQGWTMVYKPLGTFVFSKDMKYGDRSEDVRQLQIRLGLPAEFQTGSYFEKTREAVLNYQLNHITLSFYERYILRGKMCGVRTRAFLNQ